MLIFELIIFYFQHPVTTQLQFPKTTLQASKPQADIQDLDWFKLLVHFSLPMRDPLHISSKPAFKHHNPATSNLTSSWAWSAEIEHLFTPADNHAFPSSSLTFIFIIHGLQIPHSCCSPPKNPAKYEYAGRCRIPTEQRQMWQPSFKPTTKRSSKVIYVCSYSCHPKSSKGDAQLIEEHPPMRMKVVKHWLWWTPQWFSEPFMLVVAWALWNKLMIQCWTLSMSTILLQPNAHLVMC